MKSQIPLYGHKQINKSYLSVGGTVVAVSGIVVPSTKAWKLNQTLKFVLILDFESITEYIWQIPLYIRV